MALGIFVGLHGGGSSGCSIGGADGSTGGLLGVEVGTVEGEFDGSVLGFRLGTSNHDGKAMGAKVGPQPYTYLASFFGNIFYMKNLEYLD